MSTSRFGYWSSTAQHIHPKVHDPHQRYYSSTATCSQEDSMAQYVDCFDTPEYLNPWSTQDVLPVEEDAVLDQQSRFLLYLLQQLYQVSLTKTVDRVTTPRIHVMMNRLEQLPGKSSQTMWQRAERARALLEAMELFEPLRKERYLPVELPLPTRETYWRVLRMYGSKYLHGSLEQDAASHCLNIVKRMHNSNLLELQPTSLHWNYVLSAYANSSDENRPKKAAELLYSLDSKKLTDGSSFSHALRSCVSLSARQQETSVRFEQLGLLVGQRIWNGLKLSDRIDTEAFHYVHMMRIGRNIRDKEERDDFVNRIFGEAIAARKINVHVLNEFLDVASQDLAKKVLNRDDYPKDPLKLIRQVSPEWIEEVSSESGGQNNPYEW
eukprot:Nitzschia sp. Nitz4//scaffold325_size20118//14273//15415//NITZ4_008704-RA/size20118-processed-gene-0.30-mRNA-1//-1//CDS//3329547905//8031//frame0